MVIEPNYLPVTGIFSFLKGERTLIIDDISVFKKQSYRNRTYISGANKVLMLVVPLRGGKYTLAMKDVKIDYHTNWQKIHWQSIISGYNKSPWFSFYSEEFSEHIFKKHEFLIDLNVSLIQLILRLLNMQVNIQLLSESTEQDIGKDLRDVFHPKAKYSRLPSDYVEKEYVQVFSERFGFIKNLSVIDLIFNTGPEAPVFL